MTVERFRLLFEYELWANRRVLESLEQASEHGAALRLFCHILAAQEAWLTRLRGHDSNAVVLWPACSLPEAAKRLEQLGAAIEEFLASTTEDFLHSDLRYRNQTGREFVNSPLDILTHLGLHSQHHRGQIALQLRQLGQQPAVTDFIAFRRESQR